MSGNPFYYGGMIREARYFVGRRAELDAVFAALQHLPYQAQHVNIIGPRRIGKSSLLGRVKQLAPARIPGQGIYLDGKNLPTPEAFFHKMAGQLPVAPRALEQALEERRAGRTVVLLLDELEALLEHDFPPAFFDRLRAG